MARAAPVVFLDTNVATRFLDGALPWLVDASAAGRLSFAINPIVLQELVLAGPGRSDPRELEDFLEKAEMLPIDMAGAERFIAREKTLPEPHDGVHVNDFLILSSAAACDYLLTSDRSFGTLVNGGKPRVMTPDEFREDAEILG